MIRTAMLDTKVCISDQFPAAWVRYLTGEAATAPEGFERAAAQHAGFRPLNNGRILSHSVANGPEKNA